MNNIFIQPRVETYTEYLNLANTSGLSFELGDFASPAVLNDITEYNYRKDFYKHHLKQFSSNISLHGAFFDIIVASTDLAIKRASREKVRIGLETAKELGASSIVFHSGYNSIIKNPKYKDNWLQAALFWSQMANEYDLEILLENVWDVNAQNLLELLTNINLDNVNICLDIAHINVFSQETIENWFSVLGDKITYIHYSDNNSDYDAHLAIGEGNIDWHIVNNCVKKLSNKPRVVLEVSGCAEINKSLKYLTKNKIYPYN